MASLGLLDDMNRSSGAVGVQVSIGSRQCRFDLVAGKQHQRDRAVGLHQVLAQALGEQPFRPGYKGGNDRRACNHRKDQPREETRKKAAAWAFIPGCGVFIGKRREFGFLATGGACLDAGDTSGKVGLNRHGGAPSVSI